MEYTFGDDYLGSVPTVVEKEKWRNLLLTKHIAINGEGGTPCRRVARSRT